ncbi:MAG: radical SAM protein, partial [Candidatus Delongbacteria bacterium]|nr:radical SAM protein [Candidatus Delongbacteria bacterium]
MKKLTPNKLNDYKTSFGIKKGKRVCNAPYTALYFTPEGYIKACCGQDNHYAFGKYPHSGIAAALKSKNRRTLQKSIKKNSFNFGCHACYQNIEEGNFEAAMSTQYLKYPPRRMPRVLEFELSHYCNLDCIMCNLHTKNSHDHVYDEAFIHSLKPYLKHATASRFYGGEPFLIPMYKEIWNKIKKLNPEMQIHIQSNGMVLNDEIEHLLKEMNVFLGISLDAMHKSVYEKIRKGGNFDILMRNIQKFQTITQAQNKSINYSFCPMQINWNEITEFVDFVNKNHGILFFNTVNTPKDLTLKRLSTKKLKTIITTLTEENIKSYN